jgi:biopolymer transport protein ExbD
MANKRWRKPKEPPELDVTTFLNLMVVLIPFLLITAVFSRITILELNLPTSAGSNQANKVKLTIEVIVREKGLEIGNGRRVIARFPKVEDQYDMQKLSEHLLKIKKSYPDKTDAMVLLEPDIEYNHLVHVMDAVRVVELPPEGIPESPVEGEVVLLELQKFALFPDISIGDAP